MYSTWVAHVEPLSLSQAGFKRNGYGGGLHSFTGARCNKVKIPQNWTSDR